MAERPHFVGLRELVEDLARTLALTPLKAEYRDEADLEAWLEPVLKSYLAEKLGGQSLPYDLGQEGSRGKGGIDPFPIFGTAFAPDFAIEVAETPTVAVLSTLIKDVEALPDKLGSAIGRALILSHQYPAVVSFVVCQVQREEYRHWLDREIQMDLWSRHKVKLVLREQPSAPSLQGA